MVFREGHGPPDCAYTISETHQVVNITLAEELGQGGSEPERHQPTVGELPSDSGQWTFRLRQHQGEGIHV